MSRDHRSQRAMVLIPRIGGFLWRVLCAFLRNRGILLAGGVGYNILLSIVPLFALLAVLLTRVVDEAVLLEVLSVQLAHLAPAHAEGLLEAVRALLASRDVIGLFGILMLLVFSSFVFRMLEDALAIIFHTPEAHPKRRIWVSVLLPYLFMLVLGAGLFALSLMVALAEAISTLWRVVLGRDMPFAGLSDPLLNLFSFLGVFLLFSAIYKVLPVVKIALKRALIGGFVAALLWEGVRFLLMFYFLNVSLVNVVYGSLATLIVVLLTLEVGAMIVLLGAQVIAELEYNARRGLPWYVDPRREAITHVD
ncbi:YihY/virulence factor BrkB family protein [Halomonas sp. MCCC 1A17488]|uniref:YihY/virulence factor BrkB family protein n=1 Tax=Billgrantia sulfidoxydans TaxID=2733484 RepID=A0ABX7W3D8_9GAMM|nr:MULTISPECIES: YihY/virulence factor BrkB family protein [Halomonas]MCE8015390.1 YihY/virulence factor BrkB family protein [Halomonas sp. MCCC 1A17488]MCG3238723.1 YihY/virulence factor BrkB family protein [Halomonas sp. MCCC 1A17488]QPP51308.1 YihY/virulence factor BrkB family protein [Halomonas sp. SS10-MC5]QTP54864.1 YihY/virulence factor BrkB family protein [Halomonas sulfidoxydans]